MPAARLAQSAIVAVHLVLGEAQDLRGGDRGAEDAEHRAGVEAARHHGRNEVGGHALHDLVAGGEAGDEVAPEAPAVSAATKAPGMMLVPGWVSMRKVSHLPPAIAISELANAAPPLVTLVPSTMMVAPLARPLPLR